MRGEAGCSETSVHRYAITIRHNPAARSLHIATKNSKLKTDLKSEIPHQTRDLLTVVSLLPYTAGIDSVLQTGM